QQYQGGHPRWLRPRYPAAACRSGAQHGLDLHYKIVYGRGIRGTLRSNGHVPSWTCEHKKIRLTASWLSMGRSHWDWMRIAAMTPWKTLMVQIICLLLGLSIVRCGGGGGGEGGGGDRVSDGGTPAVTTAVTIQGVVNDGTPTSPIAQALCRFVEQPNGQQGVSAVADTAGNFTLQISPQEQGVIECQHPILSTLALTTFVSTIGEAAGTIMTEEISPASNVITDIILASNTSD